MKTAKKIQPNEAFWGLFDTHGNVVKGHAAEPLTPAEEMVVTLEGLDLALHKGSGEDRMRYFNAWGTYDSTTLGANKSWVFKRIIERQNVRGKQPLERAALITEVE